MKCKFSWNNKLSEGSEIRGLPTCSNEQIKNELFQIQQNIAFKEEKGITMITGCKYSCSFYMVNNVAAVKWQYHVNGIFFSKLQYDIVSTLYEITPEAISDYVHLEGAKSLKVNETLLINFQKKNTMVQTIKDIYLYDFDGFLADIGGYMGLLLGASMFSIIKYSIETLTKRLNPNWVVINKA